MKMIDEKGRLFGKINIVDFFIILLFLIITPAFIYIYEVLSRRPVDIPQTWIKVEAVTFTIPEIAELFRPGDISYDELGKPDGKLIKVLKKDTNYAERFKNAKIDRHSTIYEYRVPVFLELELLCTKAMKNEPWFYKRTQLSLGLDTSFLFRTDKYTTYCHAIKIGD